RSPSGAVAVVGQQGADVEITFSNTNGIVYGQSKFTWKPSMNAFDGHGWMLTRCSAFTNNVWQAPVADLIYVVNSNIIRETWYNPDKVNCSRGVVTAASWAEALWYSASR